MIRSVLTFTFISTSLAQAGPFGPATTLPETTNAITWLNGDRKITALATAPINGDSRPDLIALSHSGDEIIWLDLSTSTPSVHSVSTTVNGPEAVLAIEATGDAHMDIIVSSRWNRSLTLYANDGNGNFSSGTTIASNLDTAVSLTSADLDGNGHLDIVGVTDHDKELFWISQTSAGTFTSKQTLTTLTNTPGHILSTNINTDSFPDLLVLNGGNITLLENNGSANFTATARIGNAAITSFYVTDLTGGLVDIITASATLGTSTLHTNDNSGNFITQTPISSSLAGYELTAVTDLDRDNHPDLLYASHNGEQMIWFKGDGTGSFSLQTTLNANSGPIEGVVADFDGDLDADLVQSSLYGSDLALYQGLGSSPYEFWAYDQGIDPTIDITTGDHNGDGIENLIHYATNTSPSSNGTLHHLSPETGTVGLPTNLTLPSGDLAFEFIRRTSSRPHGLTYLVQQSSTLGGWNPVTLDGGNSIVTPIDSNWERVRYTPPSPQGTRIFLRLHLTYTQP